MQNAPQRAGSAVPAEHLERLLGRAHNPFEISDALAVRLTAAVAFSVQLRSWRQHNAPPPRTHCRSYRHTFTLRDGSVRTLWELQHDTEGDGRLTFELYPEQAALRAAELRVHMRMGGEPAPLRLPSAPDTFRKQFEEPGSRTSAAAGPRVFEERGSAEHARRLLRRASNPNRPGEEVLRLLSTARRHQITRAPQPLGSAAHRAFCSVYEHAFLLADGREIRLFELEHDFTPGRRLTCEVYADEASADRAAELRALTQDIELPGPE